jgi:hypothetical protein
VTARHWVSLVVISMLGIGAMVWLMPLSARVPVMVTAEVYDRFTGHGASAKPYSYLAYVTPVMVGIVIVTVCALLYCCCIGGAMVVKNVPWQEAIKHRQDD